jgi:hypothetical protein
MLRVAGFVLMKSGNISLPGRVFRAEDGDI